VRRRRALWWPLLATLPGAVRAQGTSRVWRVGVLGPVVNTMLRNALRDIGYVEGQNLVFEDRIFDDVDRLPLLARELAKARLDVVITIGLAATRAVLADGTDVPVVFFANFDPVAIGLVDNLPRPGGRLTGILIAPDGTLAGKRVELLKAAVPHAKRIALLLPEDPSVALKIQAQDTRQAATAQGLSLLDVVVHKGHYEAAFAVIAAARGDGLVVAAHTFFMRDRSTIIELATRHKLPAIYEWREQVAEGGLMAYSTSLAGQYARIANYIDRILKGAKAGDLPIERPARFGLVVNLKAARAIGLTLPQALLLRADEVIE